MALLYIALLKCNLFQVFKQLHRIVQSDVLAKYTRYKSTEWGDWGVLKCNKITINLPRVFIQFRSIVRVVPLAVYTHIHHAGSSLDLRDLAS